MRNITFILLFALTRSVAQDYVPRTIDFKGIDLVSPLDIELILAGNFGEMRSNHFHTGLDIKTQHVEGKNVFSVERGFISRVRISPYGYGKALYVEHPNGLTTVYAHLSRFPPAIEELIYKYHEKNQSDIIDVDVSIDSLFVARGELIAYSGNSGSSTAPHLHFEIRETKTENAINPLLFDCYRSKITDKRPPRVSGIKLYAVSDKGYIIPGRSLYVPCKPVGNKWVINDNKPIDISSIITKDSYLAFGLHAIDQLDAANNICGVHNTFLLKDTDILAENKIDYINFDNNRYMNSHKDYYEFKQNNNHIHKHFKTILNPLGIYPKGNGKVDWSSAAGTYTFRVLDIHKNETTVSFTVGAATATHLANPLAQTNNYYFPDSVNTFLTPNFQVLMESGTFYEPLQKIFRIDTSLKHLSVGYQFSEHVIPVQKKYDVRIHTAGIDPIIPTQKLAIGLIGANEKLTYIGGHYIDGWVEASPRNFGTFVIVIDTISPKIQPLDFNEGRIISKFSTLELTITDDLSGVMHYKAYINDQWVLMIYDLRARRYIIPLDKRAKQHLNSGSNILRITAKDGKGNQTIQAYTLNY